MTTAQILSVVRDDEGASFVVCRPDGSIDVVQFEPGDPNIPPYGATELELPSEPF